MKKIYLSFTLLLFCLSFVCCTNKEQQSKGLRVGLVLDRGGKDDKSFNTAAFLGATKAKNEFGIDLKEVESPDDAAYEPALRTFAERGYPLVIAIGFSQRDAVLKVAPQFPKTHFALIDAVVELPNVQSLMFQEHEGSYLVGYLAALASKTHSIGFIGGMDIALIRRLQMAYEAGAKAAVAKTVVKSNYVGVTSEAWANPSRGKELALTQFGQKVDIIFSAAGATNLGVFDAAEEKKLFAVGVDSNQNGVKPGWILTSMLKRIDVAVYDSIQQEVNNSFQAGTKYFGLKDGGVDLAVDTNNEKLVAPYKDILDKVKSEIISGKVKVPDYYVTKKPTNMKATSLAVETKNLTKIFGDCVANQNINLKIKPGTVHAIVGENGAGKTTLMKLLFGLEKPTSGSIFFRGQETTLKNPLEAIQLGIGMVQQHFALVENASAIENIILGSEKSRFGMLQISKAIEDIEGALPSPSLRVPWHSKIKDLSVGLRQRVEILKVIYRKADIMIFDEPTAVLNPNESEDLYRILRSLAQNGKTILLITHKLSDVLKYADEFTVLRRNQMVGSGLVSEVSIDDLVNLVVGRPLRLPKIGIQTKTAPLFLASQVSTRSSIPIKKIQFQINKGEILGIAGVEGSGQKTLVDAILGIERFYGKMELSGVSLNGLSTKQRRQLGVSNIPEDRLLEGLWSGGSCEQNLVAGREDQFFKNGLLSNLKVKTLSQKWAEQFDVRVTDLRTHSSFLSGGNQQKLILARELADKNISLLLCHQPTRGVDIGAIELIHNWLIKLREQGSGILLLSSDMDELLQLSDRILVMYEGEICSEFKRNDFDLNLIGQSMTGVHRTIEAQNA